MTRVAFLLLLLSSVAAAQTAPLGRADSALIRRILIAEDRRDASAAALRDGARHADQRVRLLARRAAARIADSTFAARDSLPALRTPPVWPEPAWRLRYRALAAQRTDCGALRGAFTDSAWAVRLRAMDLATSACAGDDALVAALRTWIDALPPDTRRRAPGGVSWHAAAHAVVALARLRPAEAAPRIAALTRHGQWQVRMYAARAAAVIGDTAAIRRLARDSNDDVKEAAVVALARLTGHADDSLFLAVVADAAAGPQAVRAAAVAVKGTSHPDAQRILTTAFDRWVKRAWASERDVRVALLDALGRPAPADRPPVMLPPLPASAVALALGKEVRLRVTLTPASGGGSFVVRLRGDNAPIMAGRILELATAGYYDNGNWHRVEHDFVIQGGAPGSNEYVGYRAYLRDELGTVPHLRGTVGMSTRGHDTGDAQWFINLKDNPRLIREYTIFAEVVEGMDVVDGVMEGDVVAHIRMVR